MPRTYDPEFRRRVLDLVRAGRPVRVVAVQLGLAEATVYRWKAQDLVDRGVKPGISTRERDELAAARRPVQELETELALVKQAAALFEEGMRPKDTYPVIAELAVRPQATHPATAARGGVDQQARRSMEVPQQFPG